MFQYEPNCYSPFDHNKKPPEQNPPPLFTFQDPSVFDQHESSLPSIDHPALPENQINIMYTQESNITTPSRKQKQVDIKPEPSIRRLRNTGTIPRRRAGKKDRHSKICTAQGIRDRRMRLSLQIARKFFDLQDLLGYDKASKTIEWLFTKSNKAIEELFKDHPQYYDDEKSEGFVSECEVVSGKPTMIEEDIRNPSQCENPRVGSKPIDLRLASREKARARARRRTREKMMSRILEGSGGYGLDQNLGFSVGPILESNIDQGWSLGDQERVSLCGNVFGDVGTIENFLGSSSRSCPNSDYNMNPNGSLVGFLGSWDLLSNERTSKIMCAAGNDQASLGENPSSVYSATP